MTDDIRARIDALAQAIFRAPLLPGDIESGSWLRVVAEHLLDEGYRKPGSYVVTDEMIEAAAEAVHYRIWPHANWDDMPEQYREDIRAQERAALSIVLGIERKTEGVSVTTRADDDREALNGVLVNVLSNVSNFPERAQSRLLGQDMGPLRGMVVDAVLTSDVWRNRTAK